MYVLSVISIATIFNNANHNINVYGDDIEVDYRGYEVKGVCRWACKWACTYTHTCNFM